MSRFDYYLVTASHPVAGYALERYEVQVRESLQANGRTLYYCMASKLGCGKDAATPARAIQGLLGEHGYTNITIDHHKG